MKSSSIRDEAAEDENGIGIGHNLDYDSDDHDKDGYSQGPKPTDPVCQRAPDEQLRQACMFAVSASLMP
jgi:hypothetical protein